MQANGWTTNYSGAGFGADYLLRAAVANHVAAASRCTVSCKSRMWIGCALEQTMQRSASIRFEQAKVDTDRLDSRAREGSIPIWHKKMGERALDGIAQARRGRTPRLSVEMIVDAALHALSEQSGDPLSLGATARILGVTPMALYTYFNSRDDLIQAVAERLMSDFPAGDEAQLPELCIRDWAFRMRNHLLKRPQLLGMLSWEGGHSSSAWLERSVEVMRALEELGYTGSELARMTLRIWHRVMSAINVEIASKGKSGQIASDDLEKLTPDTRERVLRLHQVSGREDFYEDLMEFEVSSMIDTIRRQK
ncbi:TetR/AcrR family transcriptional regulator [Novosphingobium lindaniclasticum]|nr:TetR/AcrR family transcriptional regulator [Novosphingobium lindaniclasticum]